MEFLDKDKFLNRQKNESPKEFQIRLCKNRKEYEKLNPSNGWGTYDGLLETFREMRTICEDNPDGVFDMDL